MTNDLLLIDRIEIIKTVINEYGEDKFYISFSGGKDSTVLHHLVDQALPNNKIPRVYINTGIEYNDVRAFVISLVEKDDRFSIINSNRNITNMLKEKGYPFKSKEHSCKLNMYQKGSNAKSLDKYLGDSPFSCPKKLRYQFTEEFDMNISDRCCYELKKNVIKSYEKETNRHAILGVRLGEGGQRANHTGCVVFGKNKSILKFKPLNPCSDDFMEWYIKKNNIQLCKLYYPPYNFERTGCKGCPYAINLQKELDVMEKYLPNERKQCEIIWKPVYEEYRRLNYRLKRIEQPNLFD